MIKNDISDGSNIKLTNSYTLWNHNIFNKDWNISGYNRICEFDNVSSFWRIYNNFLKLGLKFNHFFVMKNDIQPTWEHHDNRNGGVCSFKLELTNFYQFWEEITLLMLCGKLSNVENDINGISFSPKNNWAIIKIWNKDSKNDLTKTLNDDILKKYSKFSIRYKPNNPEY